MRLETPEEFFRRFFTNDARLLVTLQDFLRAIADRDAAVRADERKDDGYGGRGG